MQRRTIKVMLLEHYSFHKKILFALALLALLAGFVFVAWRLFVIPIGPVPCPEDARQCSDGSIVRPIGATCLFPACPGTLRSSHIDNAQMERALTEYLLRQKQFSWKTREDSFGVCGVENLEPENQLFPLSVWVYCGEYIVRDGVFESVSGSSGPVKIDYPNELSYFNPTRLSHEAPRDGALYADDIKRLFSPTVQERIAGFDARGMISRIERTAFENRVAWESIKQSIAACAVKSVFQAHDRTVKVELKNGTELTAIEPELDDVLDVVNTAKGRCGQIIIAIE